jgi:hypothetical protein
MKLNCWEKMKCGREPGGKNTDAWGVCPAASDARLNGAHDGKNAGRACWVIVGTLCEGRPSNSFGEKIRKCIRCPFYAKVRAEEGAGYVLGSALIDKKHADLTITSCQA